MDGYHRGEITVKHRAFYSLEEQKPITLSPSKEVRWFPAELPGTSRRCATCANIPTLSTSSKITTETGDAIQSI